MNKWDKLTMKDRAALIKVGVANGFRNIDDIRDLYNSFYSELLNYDYDMARWADEVLDKNELFNHLGHYTDKYKKPNHPSFSNESIYSTPQTPGGRWGFLNGHDTFTPSDYQVNTYGPQHVVQGLRDLRDTNVIPTYLGGTLLDEVTVIPNRFDDGGSANPRQDALNRANLVYSNYEEAKDFDLSPAAYWLRKTLDKGLSNCTLSATLWVDPNNPYKSASNIVNNPSSGYTEITRELAVPGDLLISKNPYKGTYHTMMIEGFDATGKPILRYSNGEHTLDALRVNVPLNTYHKKDIQLGGNHIEDHYFRYSYPTDGLLPELIVTPYGASMGNYSKASGGYLDVLPKPLSYSKRPAVRYNDGGDIKNSDVNLLSSIAAIIT